MFISRHKDILESLNEEQAKALVNSFCCKDYQMILGVPSSGKHEVIARFFIIARRLKLKVLFMSLNNLAIDNVLMRMLEI